MYSCLILLQRFIARSLIRIYGVDLTMATSRVKKSDPHQQVAEFLKNLEHPLKKEIEAVRQIILNANKELTEHIKWNAPSYCFNNDDRITFNLRGKGFFQLIFHCGAKVKQRAEKEPMMIDETGLLEWITNDRAFVKFQDMTDVTSRAESLGQLVNQWIIVTRC